MKTISLFIAFVLFAIGSAQAQSSKAQVCFEASMAAGHGYEQRVARSDKARAKARPEIPYISDVPMENVMIMRGANYGYFSAKSYDQAVSYAYESCVESKLWNETTKTVSKK